MILISFTRLTDFKEKMYTRQSKTCIGCVDFFQKSTRDWDSDELLSDIVGVTAAGEGKMHFAITLKKATEEPGMRLRTFYLPESLRQEY